MAYTYDANVAKQQAELNKQGAGLKVDGFLGPLTKAAITKYASPVGPTIQSNALVPSVNAGSVTKKSSPAIISSKSATNDLNKIKSSVTEINTGMAGQATRVAQEKAQAELKKAEDEKLRIAKEQKDKELQIKESALQEAPTEEELLASKKTYADLALEKAEAESFKAAESFNSTIQKIQNGSVPLSAGEQAQIQGLQSAFGALIEEQKLTNKGAVGLQNIRGYQTGAAEYDPSFQTKIIGNIVTAGLNKVADLNIKMASAVAEMTQGFKDNKISAIKTGWEVYSKALDDRRTTLEKTVASATKAIDDARKAQKEAEDEFYERVTKPVQGIALIAQKFNAPPEVVEAMLNAGSYEEAIQLAGPHLTDPMAKFELESARLDNVLKNAQIRKINTEISQIGQPTASERKQMEADEKAAMAAIPELQDKVSNIDKLLSHKGLGVSVGPTALFGRTTPFTADVWSGQKADFIAGVEQLVSQDTLQTLLNLKAKGGTLGALSDAERIMLRSASSKIGTWTLKDKDGGVKGYSASESSFKKELETIKLLTERALKNAQGTILDDTEKESLNIYFGNEALTPGQFDPAEYY